VKGKDGREEVRKSKGRCIVGCFLLARESFLRKGVKMTVRESEREREPTLLLRARQLSAGKAGGGVGSGSDTERHLS
jgi:hypothetical protein